MKSEAVNRSWTAAGALAGAALAACLLVAGCATTEDVIVLDAAHPSIRYSARGFFVGDRLVDPNRVPGMLRRLDVPSDRVIHILIDEEAERDLKPARAFMGLLARHGYRRSLLVTKKRAESRVLSEEEAARARASARAPSRGGGKVRYKGAGE